MDKLTRLPLVGPAAAWFFRSRLWRVYEHLDVHKWSRLTAALTFTSFFALFPILALGAAIGAALLTPARMKTVQGWIAEQVPGISGQLDLQSLVDNAATVGVVAGSLLLFTGIGWAGTLRECLRALWDLEEDPGNFVLLKLRDLGVLVGLGVIGLASAAGSAFAVSAIGWAADRLALDEGGVGTALLRAAGYLAGAAVDFVLLCYVLTLLPRVSPPRNATLLAALIGAVGFEALKLLLGGYLRGVAAENMYGAFGTPIALLLWISMMARLLLFCAAWTATAAGPADDSAPVTDTGRDEGGSGTDGLSGADGASAVTGPKAATGDAPRKPPRPAGRAPRR